MMNITPTVKQLLIINIMVYIGAQIIPNSMELFGLFYFENAHFKIWQVLTHMFMHAPLNDPGIGIAHILFNMFALYSFGSYLEQIWGAKRFLFFYISCGLGAALVHTGANYYYFHQGLDALVSAGFPKAEVISALNKSQYDTRWIGVLGQHDFGTFSSAFVGPAVGASGAIYGLLTAFAFLFPNAQLFFMFVPIPIKAKYFVPALVLFDLFSGVSSYDLGGGGVAHFAHVGGAITGFLMMLSWSKNRFQQNRWN